jgi:Protein of unknown function (DUF3467)
VAEEGPQGQEIHYQLPAELANGVYANFAIVHHETEHEITIDFCQVDRIPPGTGVPQTARVVSRVHIARSFVTPLLQAISTNAFRQEDTLRQLDEEEPNGPSNDT